MILNFIYCLTNINNPTIVIATIVMLMMMSSSLNRSILIAVVSVLLVTMLLTSSNHNGSNLPVVQGFSPSTRSSTAQVCYINFGRSLSVSLPFFLFLAILPEWDLLFVLLLNSTDEWMNWMK